MLLKTRSRWLINGSFMITAAVVSVAATSSVLLWCLLADRRLGDQTGASREGSAGPPRLLPGGTLATDAAFFTYDSSELISVRAGLAVSRPHHWAIGS